MLAFHFANIQVSNVHLCTGLQLVQKTGDDSWFIKTY